MESEDLPIIDQLLATTSFAAMAEWLVTCPLAIFVSHGHRIREVCVARSFPAAVDYVDAMIADLGRRRVHPNSGTYDRHILAQAMGLGKAEKALMMTAAFRDEAVHLIRARSLSWWRAPGTAEARP